MPSRPFRVPIFVLHLIALLCVLAYLLTAEPAHCQTPASRLTAHAAQAPDCARANLAPLPDSQINLPPTRYLPTAIN